MLAEITTLPPWVSMMENLHLTRTETRIFSALTNAAGTTITNQGLVAAITWDRPSEVEPGEETVKVHVMSIRRKLRAAGVKGEIRTIWGIGYRWVAE